jgi:hypothetical protein
MDDPAWNMYVFRDGRRNVPGQRLVSALAEALDALARSSARDEQVVTALVAAGELECALADADSPFAAVAGQLTDAVAELLLSPSLDLSANLQKILHGLDAPTEVQIAVHEGFAYYALHPHKFVRLAERLPTVPRAAVIGLRSIGAQLSAVVSATLGMRGAVAPRITVRPEGHPYDRQLTLSAPLREFISANLDSTFFVVDEGPGLSGSSFLCVAEALEQAGVPNSRIVLLGSREPDVSQLRASRAVERWPRFRFLCAESPPVMPEGAAIPIAGGEWRNYFVTSGETPACWPQLEMAKFLSADRTDFYKFEGFGHFGQEIADRASLLAERGIGPNHSNSSQGFGRYQVLNGRLLRADDLSENLLRTVANYCAMRASALPASHAEQSAIGEMMRWNLQCEFGVELTASQSNLVLERPVVADGRMLPHEWMEIGDRIMKLDAASHGDDHFMPGPCDIAWDLAGFIVEWNLDRQATEFLLEAYRRQSGDGGAEARLRPYLLAYTAFRMGWSKMAAQACAGQPDESLLRRDCLRYRNKAESLLGERSAKVTLQVSPSEPAAA